VLPRSDGDGRSARAQAAQRVPTEPPRPSSSSSSKAAAAPSFADDTEDDWLSALGSRAASVRARPARLVLCKARHLSTDVTRRSAIVVRQAARKPKPTHGKAVDSADSDVRFFTHNPSNHSACQSPRPPYCYVAVLILAICCHGSEALRRCSGRRHRRLHPSRPRPRPARAATPCTTPTESWMSRGWTSAHTYSVCARCQAMGR
jgi:hypothetical protein